MNKIAFAAGLSAAVCLGSFAVRAEDWPIPTEGLQYQLDASDGSTVLTDQDRGVVTSWLAKAWNPAFAQRFAMENATLDTCPWFKADAFGGKGGIATCIKKDTKSTFACSWLGSNVATSNRTIVLVLHETLASWYPYVWGIKSEIAGSSNAALGIGTERNSWGSTMLVNNYLKGGFVYTDGSSTYMPHSTDMTWRCPADKDERLTVEISDIRFNAASGCFAALIGGIYGDATTNAGNSRGRFMGGWYGEIIVYDRKLTIAERKLIDRHCCAKWTTAPSVCTWKGSAAGGDWLDAGNWEGGVPAASNDVFIAGATVAMPDGAAVGGLFLDEASLTLAEGAACTVTDLFVTRGNATVSIANGATLKVSDVVSVDGVRPTVTLAGGKLVWNTSSLCRNTFTKKGETSCSGIMLAEYVEHYALPFVLTGTGTFVKGGGNILTLQSGDLSVGLDLVLDGGALDLNGNDLGLASLDGEGFVTNCLPGTVTLTLTAAEPTALETAIAANVRLVKQGAAKLTLGGGAREAAFELAEGAAELAEDVPPASIPGLVLHVDPSRLDSVATNAEGVLLYVKDISPMGATLAHHAWAGQKLEYNGTKVVTMPHHDLTAINGRPAILFSRKRNATGNLAYDSSLNDFLVSDTVITSRTVFAVIDVRPSDRPYSRINLFTIYGNMTACPNLLVCDRDNERWENGTPLASGRLFVDGAKVWDVADAAYQPDPIPLVKNRPQLVVLATTNGESATIYHSQPSLGSGGNEAYNYRMSGYLGEVVAYDRVLMDDELERLSVSLMKKWGITPSAGTARDLLPNDTSLAAGTTLGLNGTTNAVKKISAGASGMATVTNGTLVPQEIGVSVADGRYGALKGDADWILDGTALTFDDRPSFGEIVGTSGSISGSLGTVSPAAAANRVKKSVNRLWIPGGLLLMVR